MTFRPKDTMLGLPEITAHDTVAGIPLGTEIQAADPTYGMATFKYLEGVASTAIGTWVLYSQDDYSTVRLVANGIGQVAVAMSACVADEYGWFMIIGKARALALADFADNGRVYATATAGSVDDAVVDGDMVHNAKGASTIVGAGLAEFEIDRPYMDDIAGND